MRENWKGRSEDSPFSEETPCSASRGDNSILVDGTDIFITVCLTTPNISNLHSIMIFRTQISQSGEPNPWLCILLFWFLTYTLIFSINKTILVLHGVHSTEPFVHAPFPTKRAPLSTVLFLHVYFCCNLKFSEHFVVVEKPQHTIDSVNC